MCTPLILLTALEGKQVALAGILCYSRHKGNHISLRSKHLEPGKVKVQMYRDRCAVPDLSLTIMPSPRCCICMALPVIKSRLPEHTCCSTFQLCLKVCYACRNAASHSFCSTPCLLPCLAVAAAAAPPAGSCMSADCTGQLLWAADRSPLRQSFCAWRLQPLRLACCMSVLPQS